MKLKVLATAMLALAAVALAPAAAQAGPVRPADASCYGFFYDKTINSVQIHVVVTPACPNEGQPWLILQRRNSAGGWDYVTNGQITYPSTTMVLDYACDGTATNTYQLGPLFTVGVPGYTWYQFTDACG